MLVGHSANNKRKGNEKRIFAITVTLDLARFALSNPKLAGFLNPKPIKVTVY